MSPYISSKGMVVVQPWKFRPGLGEIAPASKNLIVFGLLAAAGLYIWKGRK